VCDSEELVMHHFQFIRYVDTQRVYTATTAATTTTTTTTTDLFLYFYQI